MKNDSIKNLLNNTLLLRFVRKYSADNLQDDVSMATKFHVKTNEDSLVIGDSTMTKAIVTKARFAGKEYSRYNLKQVREVFDKLVGDEGELIVSADADTKQVMAIQVNDTVILVNALPQTDKPKEKE